MLSTLLTLRERSGIMVSMANRLSTERRGQVIACLCEGMSIRSIVRVTGAAKNTIVKLLADLGEACSAYQDETMRDLTVKRIEADEIWSFCYAKAKNVPVEHTDEFGYGDIWTFVALDADTKMVFSWLVGQRNTADATRFMRDVADRIVNRTQLTTDSLFAYKEAVARAFGVDIDFAMVKKDYELLTRPEQPAHRRYSPASCRGMKIKVISGDPNPDDISTSYVERQNLTMRMGMRRFTRLTNGFSKKLDNHAAAISLHFMHYNFVRVHETLSKQRGHPTTPAMAAGLARHPWSVRRLLTCWIEP
jgi:IS1 family transposase